jgi:hypothetical protein
MANVPSPAQVEPSHEAYQLWRQNAYGEIGAAEAAITVYQSTAMDATP